METNDKLKTKAKYYDADPTKDVLCEGCGGKLYDADTQLLYYNLYFDDEGSHFICIHCGCCASLKWVWEHMPDTLGLEIDTKVFDNRAELYDMVPPTVVRRFEAELSKLPNSWLDQEESARKKQSSTIFDEVWTAWRAERAEQGVQNDSK